MLPDFPSLKKEIVEVLEIFFEKRVEEHTVAVREIPKSIILEGRGGVIRRKTGEEDPIAFMSSATGIELKYSDIPSMTLDDVLAKFDAAALDMAKKVETGFFKTISEELEKAGRNVSNKGEPLTGKAILNALRSISISFDRQGNAQYPSIYWAQIGGQNEKSIGGDP